MSVVCQTGSHSRQSGSCREAPRDLHDALSNSVPLPPSARPRLTRRVVLRLSVLSVRLAEYSRQTEFAARPPEPCMMSRRIRSPSTPARPRWTRRVVLRLSVCVVSVLACSLSQAGEQHRCSENNIHPHREWPFFIFAVFVMTSCCDCLFASARYACSVDFVV